MCPAAVYLWSFRCACPDEQGGTRGRTLVRQSLERRRTCTFRYSIERLLQRSLKRTIVPVTLNLFLSLLPCVKYVLPGDAETSSAQRLHLLQSPL